MKASWERARLFEIISPGNNPILILMKRLSLFTCVVATLLAPHLGTAALVGPYATDASTLHLYHLDQTALPIIDSVTPGGTNLTYSVSGLTLGTASFSTNSPTTLSFTNCVNFGTLAASNGVLTPIGTGFGGTAIPFTYAGASGAFTFEAIVYIGFNATNGFRNQPCQIMNCDANGTGTRVLQFRIDPLGFSAGGRNTNTCGIEFINGTTTVAVAPIPTNGPDMIISNSWYHVAVTYNGTPNTTSNLLFYWTALDPSRTTADCIYGTNMTANLPGTSTATTIFTIGNSGRNPSGNTANPLVANFLGDIDELRISSVARAANAMEFFQSGTPITYSTQPVSAWINTNEVATLNVLATGPGTIAYQWYAATASATNVLANQTNTSLTITSGSVTGTTNFYVVASNGGLSAPSTSSVATLTIRLPGNQEWAGQGSIWDTSSLFWTTTGGSSFDAYTEVDNVTFDDLGAAQPTVSLSAAHNPNSVTVAGATSYLLNGLGWITGPATLTMNGSGILTIDTTNVNTGGTLISSGTLQVGDNTFSGQIGSGPVTNNGALVLEPAAGGSIVFPSPISGPGGLTMNGGGSATLSASNTYMGNTIISVGRIFPLAPTAFGSGNVSVASGAQIYATAGVDFYPAAWTLSGSGLASDGVLRKGGSSVTSFGGTVTLGGDTTLAVDGGSTLNLTNAAGINGSAANANLTLLGPGAGNISGPLSLGVGNLTVSSGTWTVAPNNSFSGLTTVSGGTLRIPAASALGPVPSSFNASEVTLNGGILDATNTVNLVDGNIGIMLNASSGLGADTNAVFTISNVISTASGSFTLTKSGPGTVVLEGANSFNGILDVDSGSTSANDGMLVIAANAAIANIPAIPGSPFINIRNNNGGNSTLGLNGTMGSITIAPDINLDGRNVSVPAIENLAGNNTISGNIELQVGGGFYQLQSDSGVLTMSANIPYSTPTSSGRTLTFQGAGTIVVTGVVQDGSNNGSSNVWVNVLKNGSGLLDLPSANTYSGTTVVSNGVLSLTGSLNSLGGTTVAGGLLVGSGSISGPVAVVAPGSIEAGASNVIGTLTLANTLSLAGNTVVKINQNTMASDSFSGQTSITYGGTLTVTNLAGTLALGDSFTLFNPGNSASNFSSIIGSPGAGLAYSFANGVLSVVTGVASNPTNITANVSGNTLTLSWPSDHLGWILQAQTNSLAAGLVNDWVDVSNSITSTQSVITVTATNPAVFYRLRHP